MLFLGYNDAYGFVTGGIVIIAGLWKYVYHQANLHAILG
jgi:hypothetical protein